MGDLVSTTSSKDKLFGHKNGPPPQSVSRPAMSGPQSDLLNLQRAAGNQAVNGRLKNSGPARWGTGRVWGPSNSHDS
jgi:hypothetical protein